METTLNPKPYSTLGLYEDTGNENGKPTLMSGVCNCEPRVLGLGLGSRVPRCGPEGVLFGSVSPFRR